MWPPRRSVRSTLGRRHVSSTRRHPVPRWRRSGRSAGTGARPPRGRTHRPELSSAAVRHRFEDAGVRGSRRRPHRRPRHEKDHAHAARAGEVRGRAGGGTNHRVGLFDAVLIKDNHVRLSGGVEAAVRRVRARSPGLRVEVEAQTLDEVDAALRAGAEIILADNFSVDDIREVVPARQRSREGRDLRRGHAGTDAGAGVDRRGLRVGRRADALGAGRRHQLRDRAGLNASACRSAAAGAGRRVRRRAPDGLGRLGTSWRYYTTVGSTNDVAAALAAGAGDRAAAEGAVVIADAQTAGRGRRGTDVVLAAGERSLPFDGPGARARESSPERATSLVTLAAGVALAEAIERVTGLAAQIKWPNDLLVGRRKLAGILAEGLAADRAGAVGHVVLGYGINVGRMSVPPELLRANDVPRDRTGARGRSRRRGAEIARRARVEVRRPVGRTVRCYSRRVAPALAFEPGHARDVDAWRSHAPARSAA